MIKIQREMAERALELLALPQDGIPKLILDLGCGSGLSGAVLGQVGHLWVGMDISPDMISVANQQIREKGDFLAEDVEMRDDDDLMGEEDSDYDDEEEDGYQDDDESADDSDGETPESCIDLFTHDMGDGIGARPGTFDGCISISALQWLCHSNRSSEKPKARLSRLFSTLFGCLSRGARAIFQFYPETSSQIELILACAMKAGFTGGLVVDYPNSTKAKKYYLCLMTGQASEIPRGLDLDESSSKDQVAVGKRSKKRTWRATKADSREKRKEWVRKKKELSRKRGQVVKSDSKFTARKRKTRF